MLTRRQQACQRAICDYFRKFGRAPSHEELKVTLGFTSKSSVHRLVTALVDRGYLIRRNYKRRALAPLLEPDGTRFNADADLIVVRMLTAYDWGRQAQRAGRPIDSCQLAGDFGTAWRLGWTAQSREQAGETSVEIWGDGRSSTESLFAPKDVHNDRAA